MTERITVWRSMHDVGLAAWFGGSLMGALGLNGAAKAQGASETQRARIASAGWARWAPVNAAALGLHLLGGAALLAVNAPRLKTQQGVAASTMAKATVTSAAIAASFYTRALGKKVELASSFDPEDREKAEQHPVDLKKAQQHLSLMQWAVPFLTGAVVVLNALHGEQQRPSQQKMGVLKNALPSMHCG